MSRLFRSASIWAAFVLLVAGCVSDNGSPTAASEVASSSSSSTPDSQPRIYVPTYPGDGSSDDPGPINGTIVFAGECLLIADSDAVGKLVLPLFPDKLTSWDDAARELTFDGQVYREGDSIIWGGGGKTGLSAAAGITIENAPPNYRDCGAESAWRVAPSGPSGLS